LNYSTNTPTRSGEFWAGVKATLPLVIGAIPFGIIVGAVAVTSGVSPAGALAMSAFVFAGSAQFIAVGMVAGGAGVGVIILTTFLVNLRHALYSVTLAPYMKHLPQRWLAPLGFWLTDETFVVVVSHYQQADGSPYKQWYHLGSSVFMYLNWQLCTLIGVVAGQSIHDPRSWGLDFALVVTFIGMVVPMIRNRAVLASVLVAGSTAALAQSLPNQLWLILAAVLGVAAGVIVESLEPKPVAQPTLQEEAR